MYVLCCVCVFLQVSSVIASVEDTLGLPSPHELGQGEGGGGGGGGGGEGAEFDDETSKLAEGE